MSSSSHSQLLKLEEVFLSDSDVKEGDEQNLHWRQEWLFTSDVWL